MVQLLSMETCDTITPRQRLYRNTKVDWHPTYLTYSLHQRILNSNRRCYPHNLKTAITHSHNLKIAIRKIPLDCYKPWYLGTAHKVEQVRWEKWANDVSVVLVEYNWNPSSQQAESGSHPPVQQNVFSITKVILDKLSGNCVRIGGKKSLGLNEVPS